MTHALEHWRRARTHIAATVLAGALALLPLSIAVAGDTVPALAFANQFRLGCPTADASDIAALRHCRTALAASPARDAAFAPDIIWGGDTAGKPLEGLTLTRFDSRLFVDLYASLYMAEGAPRLSYDADKNLSVIDLPARFRNALSPGEYPYPFWHSAAKWEAYQQSNMLRFFLRPADGRIIAVLRATLPGGAPTVASPIEPPAFDGRWMWQRDGQVEPRATLFSTQFAPDNPYLAAVETTYRAFADALRESTCLSCHVPDNPNGAKRLILLQTPAHAAGEIRHVLREVADDKMPVEDWGTAKPLDSRLKHLLLDAGGAFAAALDRARAWQAHQAPP